MTNFTRWFQANTMPPEFIYRVEEQQEDACEGKIIVEAVINQELNRETVGFSYTFPTEEFIADEPCPLKDDLFSAFLSGGITAVNTLSYINNSIIIARNITSSAEYGPNYLIRFIFNLHCQPSSLVFEEYLDTNYESDEETTQLNIAINNSLAGTEIDFIPTNTLTVNSLEAMIFTERHSETISCEGPQCVICLSNFISGAEIIKLDCGHIFDRECILKWLNTSHYCPICKFEFPI